MESNWARVQDVYHAALGRPVADRAAFVRAACAGDVHLQREVESLLARASAASAFLNEAAVDAAAKLMTQDTNTSGLGSGELGLDLIGRQIGVYLVTARLGAGGMGEVYRARDTKLGRDVAIKVLPAMFTADADRLARFEREARLLATLNHPNIGAIYGLEDSDGLRALVLELVEGLTLAEKLAQGSGRKAQGLPLKDVLAIARQIAEALDAAHEKGIIHRDLKPANIKITPDGTVKVLDFGLAKLAQASGAGPQAPGLSNSPTVTMGGTREGMVVGTAAYMSPEQARGKPVDKRTDIWAFGCVLYEMLTGRSAFGRDTVTDTLSAVIDREPDWSALPTETPASVQRILKRCLEKDTKKRIRDIGDISSELADANGLPSASARRSRSILGQRYLGWALGVLLGLGLAAGGWLFWRRSAPPPTERRVQFGLTIAEQSAGDNTTGTIPTPSPNGQILAFIAGDSKGTRVLWVRPLDSVRARPLADTEGASGAVVWSPDGRWIAFFADGKLKKIAPDGGPAQTIAAIQGFQDADWGTAGEIIFRPSNRNPIFRVSESGGAFRQVTKLDASRSENSHRFLQFLPDGRRFLFTARCANRENNALYIGSLDSDQRTRVMSAQSRVSYVPRPSGGPGTLLFYRDGALMTQSFNLARLSLEGEPAPVFDKISYLVASIQAGFRASADGHTVIVEDAGANENRFTWFSREGENLGTVGPPGQYLQPRISPSGDRVAFTKPDDQTGNRDVWYMDLARGTIARVTVNGANDWFPVWSASGKQLLFESDREEGNERPYLKTTLDVGGDEAAVQNGIASPWDWSRDGRWIATSGDGNILVQALGSDARPFHFLATQFVEFGGRFSLDGKWIAYVSNETGRQEVYVRPFTGGPASAEGMIQISPAGGDFPTWGPDGLELFYMTSDFSIFADATKDLGRPGERPTPKRLFKACPDTAPFDPPGTMQSFGYAFDTYDGQKFLVNCRVQPTGRYIVLLNPLAPK